MRLAERAIDLGAAGASARARRGRRSDLDASSSTWHADHLPHARAHRLHRQRRVAARYPDWLRRGVHVVTPNKRANTADRSSTAALREARRQSGAHYLYETTVGAGLPIIQTLRDLIQTGDEIEIEGIFSGTLSYLFNVFDGSRPFSEIVREREGEAATPSRTRATTCRGWTSRASW
jgi:bifunctional aspartokinase / homoserine dehydrogenase 1